MTSTLPVPRSAELVSDLCTIADFLSLAVVGREISAQDAAVQLAHWADDDSDTLLCAQSSITRAGEAVVSASLLRRAAEIAASPPASCELYEVSSSI